MQKIKKGDLVIIIAGRDKQRQGVVLSIVAGQRVVVEGLNKVKRHTKPSQNKPGGIIEKEASIAISNVAIFNNATQRKDRVGFKILNDGRKVRVFKSTGEVVDV